MYTFISILILCPEILKILMKGKGHYSISYYLFTFYRQYSDSIR